MQGYYRLLWPFLRMVDPERAHHLAIASLRWHMVPPTPRVTDPVLRTRLWGIDFPNPVGLAAGFDKNAEVVGALLGHGFGAVEVGTVTPRPQPGNPTPRLFRLVADRAVINRMGFNNAGIEAMAARLARRRRPGIVGVNLGKNKDSADAVADYVAGVERLGPLADYLVVNVSSPNTPGLRALQGRGPLEDLLRAVLAARDGLEARPPLLLKIAPDLTAADKADIAEVVLATGVDGLIATNTTIERPAELADLHRAEDGGLSGRPLRDMALGVLKDMYRLTEGRLPIVGVGGIETGEDAYARIRAGASMVQVYSALIYEGMGLVARINRDLAARLKADGFTSVAEAVGADAR